MLFFFLFLILSIFRKAALASGGTAINGCPQLDFHWHTQIQNIMHYTMDITNVILVQGNLFEITIHVLGKEQIPLQYLYSLKVIGVDGPKGTIQLYGKNENTYLIDNPTDFTVTFQVYATLTDCQWWLPNFQIQFEYLQGDAAQYWKTWTWGTSTFDLSTGCNNYDNQGHSQTDFPGYYWVLGLPSKCGVDPNPSSTSIPTSSHTSEVVSSSHTSENMSSSHTSDIIPSSHTSEITSSNYTSEVMSSSHTSAVMSSSHTSEIRRSSHTSEIMSSSHTSEVVSPSYNSAVMSSSHTSKVIYSNSTQITSSYTTIITSSTVDAETRTKTTAVPSSHVVTDDCSSCKANMTNSSTLSQSEVLFTSESIESKTTSEREGQCTESLASSTFTTLDVNSDTHESLSMTSVYHSSTTSEDVETTQNSVFSPSIPINVYTSTSSTSKRNTTPLVPSSNIALVNIVSSSAETHISTVTSSQASGTPSTTVQYTHRSSTYSVIESENSGYKPYYSYFLINASLFQFYYILGI